MKEKRGKKDIEEKIEEKYKYCKIIIAIYKKRFAH